MKVTFWGVRGSIPAPLTSDQVAQKFLDFLRDHCPNEDYPISHAREVIEWNRRDGHVFAYGGNTSCVSVEAGSELLGLDMGTGARLFGDSLMPGILKKRGTGEVTRMTICESHLHSDHTQGTPFFSPLFLSKYDGFLNDWTFYGGTDYYARIDEVLLSQINPPVFPVPLAELRQRTHGMRFETLQDGLVFTTNPPGITVPPDDIVKVTSRKLDHPQETHGFRIEHDGSIVAYTTDHEPRDPRFPYKNLLRLAQDADLWITDCQYSDHQYRGKANGPERFNWGHSYPEAIAHTAAQAKVKRVVLFHHDPASSDEDIRAIAASVRDHLAGLDSGAIEVVPAHEGLVMAV